MGLMDRFRRNAEVADAPCPRCGIPAPSTATTCNACGWDLSEVYRGAFAGSHLKGLERDRAH